MDKNSVSALQWALRCTVCDSITTTNVIHISCGHRICESCHDLHLEKIRTGKCLACVLQYKKCAEKLTEGRAAQVITALRWLFDSSAVTTDCSECMHLVWSGDEYHCSTCQSGVICGHCVLSYHIKCRENCFNVSERFQIKVKESSEWLGSVGRQHRETYSDVTKKLSAMTFALDQKSIDDDVFKRVIQLEYINPSKDLLKKYEDGMKDYDEMEKMIRVTGISADTADQTISDRLIKLESLHDRITRLVNMSDELAEETEQIWLKLENLIKMFEKQDETKHKYSLQSLIDDYTSYSV